MDHINRTNKKMFLWIESGGSSFPGIKKEGPQPYLLSLSNPFTTVGKEPPEPPKQLKLGLLSQEGRSACESRQAWQSPSTSQVLAQGLSCDITC